MVALVEVFIRVPPSVAPVSRAQYPIPRGLI
jgi:hypothetical protein